jgi:hypothetical protein
LSKACIHASTVFSADGDDQDFPAGAVDVFELGKGRR